MRIKWTLELCKSYALKYHTKKEFKKNNIAAYTACLRHKWTDQCCQHMVQLKKPSGYWNLERCIEEGAKFKTRRQWELGSTVSYVVCMKNKWDKFCCGHMIKNKIKSKNYWNFETCKLDALNYETKKSWSDNSYGYEFARINDWLNECCSHMRICGNLCKRLIYAYEFPDNSVYIGLTYDEIKRNYQHLEVHKNSTVYKHIQKTNLKPKFVKFSSYIDEKEAAKLEGKIKDKYKKEGWNILNKISTGGLGGNILKWNLINCQKNALNYNSRKEWSQSSPSAYKSCRINGWDSLCCNHMEYKIKPNNYWNLERCIEQGLKYKSRSEWLENCSGSYSACKKNGWDNFCCNHMVQKTKPMGYWTLERCLEEAAKYKSKSELRKHCGGAYNAAYKKQWLNKLVFNI